MTDPLLYSNDPTQSGYLFWDTVHPTAQVGQYMADVAYSSMVPEPSSMTLVLIAAPADLPGRRGTEPIVQSVKSIGRSESSSFE